MKSFTFNFTVRATKKAVAAFHHDASNLKRLNPPIPPVQFHRIDPMKDGSISEFTLWLGPIPLRWRAVHSNVGVDGFTDCQESGPLAAWEHTHHFEALDENTTRIFELVSYAHKPGWQGWLTRLLFSTPGLRFLFAYRKWVTRRALEAG